MLVMTAKELNLWHIHGFGILSIEFSVQKVYDFIGKRRIASRPAQPEERRVPRSYDTSPCRATS